MATMNGTIIGWAKTHYWNYSDGAASAGHYLGGVTVARHFRRIGVADKLTAVRLEWIWQRAAEAWCVISPKNLASIALHQRFGFREMARSDRFHTTTFNGAEGILYKLSNPHSIADE
ncbi:hypothetical protein GCM10011399_28580 [Subtercola lobariae]|uniref:N-acetyltransferase domain-containing protein n=1 Tax=Subtercola lobariae TaxID=1588641 RepID=A0A917EYB8_9MICO|nr:hypothetical protein GCM10011399_28580 [Subtercola lobariae]